MNNVFILQPYKIHGQVWVFDDPSRGLKQEPFVGETNTIIDEMINRAGMNLKKAEKGFLMFFSPTPVPEGQIELSLMETSPYGSILQGWLCPALFKYFPAAPDKLFAFAKPLV